MALLLVAVAGMHDLKARAADTDSDAAGARPTQASTIVVDEARGRVWSVNPDHDSVTAIDVRRLVKLFEARTGDHPRTLAIAPDGTVWVVNQDDASLSILDGDTGRTRKRVALPYASRPYGIAFNPRGDAAYVTLQAVGRLLRVDAQGSRVTATVDVGPTPRGLAVTADGNRILVTRYISPQDRGEVTEVDAASLRVVRRFELALDPGPDGPLGSRGVPNHLAAIAIAPDGRAWVLSKKDNTGRGLHVSGKPLTFETTTRTIVSQLDLKSHREILAARRDLDNRAMAVAMAFGREGKRAFIALQGSNAVDVLDVASGQVVGALPEAGSAPQGLLVDARGRLFVQNFLSRDVAVFDLADADAAELPSLLARIDATAVEPLPPKVLLGKRIFHNAADERMSRDGYVSCASCHIEGGSDARVWDFSGRGVHGGGLRNTITLHGRAGLGHGPVHWRADMDEIQDFEMLMRTTLQGAGFVADAIFAARAANWVFGPPSAGLSRELDALAAYVASFTTVHPSPHRRPGGAMTTPALAGELVFHAKETGCATCHAPARFTDSSLNRSPGSGRSADCAPAAPCSARTTMHDVGTLSEAAGDFRANTLRALDTPTLKGVWETAPYLHDGSAATLMEVIERNAGDLHGTTSHLTDTEKQNLVAYLEQLDDTPVATSLSLTAAGSQSMHTLRFEGRAGGTGGLRVKGMSLQVVTEQTGLVARVFLGTRDAGGPLAEAPVSGDEIALTFHAPPLIGAGAALPFLVTVTRADTENAPVTNVDIVLTGVEAEGLTSRDRSITLGMPLGNRQAAPPSGRTRPRGASEAGQVRPHRIHE